MKKVNIFIILVLVFTAGCGSMIRKDGSLDWTKLCITPERSASYGEWRRYRRCKSDMRRRSMPIKTASFSDYERRYRANVSKHQNGAHGKRWTAKNGD